MKVTIKNVQDRITILQNLRTISINEEFQLACLRILLAHMTAPTETDAELKAQRDALAAKVKQLEWDSVFIPNDIDRALTVMGVALPESKEELNFSINRWVQRLVDQVVRFGPELDAERNNLRAEGVEMFAAAIQGGHAVGDRAKDLAGTFAAQLRAGEPS